MPPIDAYSRAVGSSREALIVLAAVLARTGQAEVTLSAADLATTEPAQLSIQDDTISIAIDVDPDEFPPAIGGTTPAKPNRRAVAIAGVAMLVLVVAVAAPFIVWLWRALV